MSSMTPLGLVETIRVEGGRARWLDEHQARLDRSWPRLHPGPPPVLRDLLARLDPAPRSDQALLVRLAFQAEDGAAPRVEVSSRRLTPLARPIRVELAPTPRREPPEDCRCKVADRGWLVPLIVADAAETLLWSRTGRLLEGTRSNVFFHAEGRWRTPPEEDGLVPGVVRARVLGSRSGREVSLTSWDLSRLGELDALVLSGTGIGLMPVASLGARALDEARAAEFAARLLAELEEEHGPGGTGSGTMER